MTLAQHHKSIKLEKPSNPSQITAISQIHLKNILCSLDLFSELWQVSAIPYQYLSGDSGLEQELERMTQSVGYKEWRHEVGMWSKQDGLFFFYIFIFKCFSSFFALWLPHPYFAA